MRHKAVGMMMSTVFSLILVLPTQAQTEARKLNGGLQAQIVSVGRDKTFSELTVSMTLANTGKTTIYLLLLPGAPSTGPKATSGGVTFFYESASGVAICPSFDAATCIGVPNMMGAPPLQIWTELDPETSPITVNFHLHGWESHSHLASFSGTFAYRVVSNPGIDGTLTETQKRKQIQTMNLSFPPTQVVDEP
jgi:hypothetical protein